MAPAGIQEVVQVEPSVMLQILDAAERRTQVVKILEDLHNLLGMGAVALANRMAEQVEAVVEVQVVAVEVLAYFDMPHSSDLAVPAETRLLLAEPSLRSCCYHLMQQECWVRRR